MSDPRHPATAATRAALAAAAAALPPDDPDDLADAMRGRIAPLDPAPIPARSGGHTAWDFARFAAFQGPDAPCPDTVHPGLWRLARLNAIGGLFRVSARVHQVRGLDLSNITFIEGTRGRIVVDPLISRECAEAALALADRHLGARPVSALIYTHSHSDHFGGSEALADRMLPGAPIVAPDRFLTAAVSENVLAGHVMRRRAIYMYGTRLPADARGLVDAGLGKTTSAGRVGLLPPDTPITTDGETRTIDGVACEFLLAPETEAPAEMLFYLPDEQVLNAADDACAGLHNLYTLRGAEVRDARAWSRALDLALDRFGARAAALCGGHHWPRFGRTRIATYLAVQRDVYRFIHDQTLRLANAGLTPREIAEQLRLPADYAPFWYIRDYYGTVAHNAKAVYQRYLGWFDGHPANLDPLPPEAAAPRYVAFMGGADALLAKARDSFAAGDYRFVAEVLTHLVFAEPANREARALQAQALEQLGYRSESAAWRNTYLTGAQELRAPAPPPRPPLPRLAALPMASLLPVSLIFEALAVGLNGDRAAGQRITIAWEFPDIGERFLMRLERAVLHHWPDRDEPAELTLTLTRAALLPLLREDGALAALTEAGTVRVAGDEGRLAALLALIDPPARAFPIVTP